MNDENLIPQQKMWVKYEKNSDKRKSASDWRRNVVIYSELSIKKERSKFGGIEFCGN